MLWSCTWRAKETVAILCVVQSIMTAHECVAKNMIHLRDALFICAALYLRSVSTLSFHFIMLITLFFLLIILVCALSCLEWKVKFISIKSKSFVFLSFERASKHHPHTSIHTHTRAELFKWLIVWPISVMGSNVIRDWFRHRALIMD